MKPMSIYRKISNVISRTLLLMLVTCIVLTFFSFRAFDKLYKLFDQQQTFFSFENVLNDLQNSLVSQSSGGDVEEDEIRLFSDELSSIASSLPKYFSHAQFVDTQLLTEVYLEEANQLNEYFLNGESGKIPGTVEQVQKLYQELLMQYKTTETFEKELINQNAEKIRNDWSGQIIVVILFVCLLTGFFYLDSRRMVRRIVGPLLSLTNYANRISSGDFSAYIKAEDEDDSGEEVSRLIYAFTRMLDIIRAQMEELKEKMTLSQKLHDLEVQNMQMKVMLARAEMAQIQSLINPHFLFNCLSMVGSMAIIENAPRTHKYSLNVARFLRTSLKLVGRIITLREEIQHISDYTSIQKMRFGERIEFEVNCDAECEGCVLPAIIIQPLVENSLVHGIGSYPSGGKVKVNAIFSDGFVQLTVEDNGVGMSADKVQNLRKKLSEYKKFNEKKTGLYGVMYRMQYFFEGNAQMDIESIGRRTIFILKFPGSFSNQFPEQSEILVDNSAGR